jgi:hypothetical protein
MSKLKSLSAFSEHPWVFSEPILCKIYDGLAELQ